MTEEQNQYQSQITHIELEKVNLEKEKLIEELKILKKKWYLNTENLKPLAAIVVAILGLILTHLTGIFDARLLELKNEKSLLQIEIHEFTKQKDSIMVLVVSSQKTLDMLATENRNLKINFISANKKLKEIATRYKAEKIDISNELELIDKLLKENKTDEAFDKISDLVDKLNGITGRSFSNGFSNGFK
jgi:FtsZ-binding cell division protein ZapB